MSDLPLEDLRIVIIGSGQGGLQMAASLRQEGHKGPLTLIGEEPGLPYQRPPLSKAYMADGNAGALTLKPDHFFEKQGVDLIHGTRATKVDRALRQVMLTDGRSIPYDLLVLATGTSNFLPPIPGIDSPGALGLRTLQDAERLRAAMAGASHAVVVGGGFIGLEFAAMARKTGLPVTVVEAAPRLMARAISAPMSAAFAEKHRAMGTDLRLNALAAEITLDAQGHARGVRLKDGTEIAGDLILIATGVRPNIELAAEAGLDLANGVAVDGCLRSSDPAIFALGDVCAFPMEGAQVRLESVQAAVDHARHIARVVMKGETGAYAALPWFWSDQADWKLQIAGLSTGSDEVLALPRADAPPLVLHLRDGHLLAVESVNDAGSHMAGRNLVGSPRALLEEAGFDLKEALKLKKSRAT